MHSKQNTEKKRNNYIKMLCRRSAIYPEYKHTNSTYVKKGTKHISNSCTHAFFPHDLYSHYIFFLLNKPLSTTSILTNCLNLQVNVSKA